MLNSNDNTNVLNNHFSVTPTEVEIDKQKIEIEKLLKELQKNIDKNFENFSYNQRINFQSYYNFLSNELDSLTRSNSAIRNTANNIDKKKFILTKTEWLKEALETITLKVNNPEGYLDNTPKINPFDSKIQVKEFIEYELMLINNKICLYDEMFQKIKKTSILNLENFQKKISTIRKSKIRITEDLINKIVIQKDLGQKKIDSIYNRLGYLKLELDKALNQLELSQNEVEASEVHNINSEFNNDSKSTISNDAMSIENTCSNISDDNVIQEREFEIINHFMTSYINLVEKAMNSDFLQLFNIENFLNEKFKITKQNIFMVYNNLKNRSSNIDEIYKAFNIINQQLSDISEDLNKLNNSPINNFIYFVNNVDNQQDSMKL